MLNSTLATRHPLQFRRIFYLAILFSVLCISNASFGQLLQWNTFGNAGTETTEPSTFNNTNIGSATLNYTGSTVTPAGNANRFGGSAWGVGTPLNTAKYIQFTVSPNSGFSFTATSLVFIWDFSGTGPSAVTLRSSTDNYTADLGTLTGMTTSTSVFKTLTITGVSNITAATTFRLYGFGATAAGGTGGFDCASSQNNVTLNGTTSAAVVNHTVTFNNNGGVGTMANQTASTATNLTANTFTRTGYTYSKWNTLANGTGTDYSDQASYPFTVDATLYAQWIINTYSVAYNGNTNDAGSAPTDGSSPYNYNSNVTILGAGTLTKAGFVFNGWNTAADGSGTGYTAGQVVTGIAASLTLFAQWVPANTYAVTYNGNTNTGGSAPVDGSSPYTGGANVTVQGAGSLVKTGYTFAGWNTAADGSGTAYAAGGTITAIAASTTLYAQWTINTYTVLYDGNGNDGGSAPVDPSSPYNYNSNVTVLGAGSLTKTNYSFTGWNTAANGSGTAYAAGATITAIAANVTLYAQWTINTFTVTYNGNTNTGGAVPVDGSSPYAATSNATVLGVGTLAKTGYSFNGWNTAADGSGTAYVAGGTITNILANTVLYAQWTINTYTVSYNGNGNTGGTAPVDALSPYNFGSTVTVLANTGALVKAGSDFAGWNTAADGTGTNYAATGAVTFTLGAANVTLYAKWAQPLYESFSYTAGDNIGGTATGNSNNNWTMHSGSGANLITAGSLNYTGLQTSTGNKVRISTAVSSDINRAIALPSGSTVGYYSMLLNVADNTSLTAGGDYLAGFGGTAGASVSILYGRLFIKSSGTGFQLGVTNNSGTGTSTTYYTTDLSFATSYLVVVKYDFNGAANDVVSLWVNPSSLGGTEPTANASNSGSATVVANFASVFLRNGSATPKADIDEVRAGSTWAQVTPLATYQLTTAAGTGGTVTAPASSPTTVNHATATTITATANSGFAFSGWTVTAGSATIADANAASTTVTLTSGNATVQANFIATNFTITATAIGGGSISPAGAVTVNPGGSQTFNITADPCNDIAEVIIDGTESLGAVNTYTFTNVSADHTIDVYFNPSTSTTWTGAVSTAWDDVANWSGCLPNETLDVIIAAPGGTVLFQPVLNTDAAVNGLTINDGATLSIADKTLTINGGFTGSAAATLAGSDAANLVVNSTISLISSGTLKLHSLTINGGTTTLASAVDISGGTATILPGNVTVQAGALLESNGFLTIKSNIYGTAAVAAGDDAGNYISGNVTVERYVPNNGFRAWRLLAVPTFGSSQTIRQAWQEGIANPSALQNNLPGFGTQITSVGSLATAQAAGYDNVSASAALLTWGGAAWVNSSSTNTTIDTKKGYFLFLRGDRSKGITGGNNASSATTLRTKGQLYQGTQAIPAFPASSFNLVGNLYASAIDFTQLIRTGGVNNLFYIWDSKKLAGTSLGAYQTFSATNSFQCLISGGSYTLGQPNTKIESGQAFFVTTAATGTITLTEGSKIATGASLGFRPVTPVNSLVKIDSRLYAANSSDILDANVVVFNDVYTNAVADEDAAKLTNPAENFGIQQAGKTLSIEGRHTITATDNIQFNMWNLKQQEYKLELLPQNMATPGLTATLEDSYLHSSTTISLDAANTISFTVDATDASKAADRFRIVFAKVKPAVVSEQGYSIAPNPVENGKVNIVFSNQSAGKYSVRIISNGGQAITAKVISHTGGNSNQQVALPQGIKAGIYQVEIIAPNNAKTTQSLLVK